METIISFENLPIAVSEIAKRLTVIESLLREKGTTAAPPELDQLMTVKEASDFLSLSVPTIYSKVSRGELPVMKGSKRLYFSRIELMDYLRSRRKLTNTEVEANADQYLNVSRKR